ncbi:hypothetical protein CLOLEP_00150 [[Clostridium] leptum DSM 753]|uniref:Uncharacterized protein n=1 Tax=[Clostridium] leptum DSM 753 TaxID=428125 RepID=A7VNM3_9FIRM|nr:hypothetical protein CLOLEP_00150 [[Clostridium] leptum DSM 753]
MISPSLLGCDQYCGAYRHHYERFAAHMGARHDVGLSGCD